MAHRLNITPITLCVIPCCHPQELDRLRREEEARLAAEAEAERQENLRLAREAEKRRLASENEQDIPVRNTRTGIHVSWCMCDSVNEPRHSGMPCMHALVYAFW